MEMENGYHDDRKDAIDIHWHSAEQFFHQSSSAFNFDFKTGLLIVIKHKQTTEWRYGVQTYLNVGIIMYSCVLSSVQVNLDTTAYF